MSAYLDIELKVVKDLASLFRSPMYLVGSKALFKAGLLEYSDVKYSDTDIFILIDIIPETRLIVDIFTEVFGYCNVKSSVDNEYHISSQYKRFTFDIDGIFSSFTFDVNILRKDTDILQIMESNMSRIIYNIYPYHPDKDKVFKLVDFTYVYDVKKDGLVFYNTQKVTKKFVESQQRYYNMYKEKKQHKLICCFCNTEIVGSASKDNVKCSNGHIIPKEKAILEFL
jgi:hypothetical protein